MNFLAVLFDGTSFAQKDADTHEEAEEICRQHLGGLSDDMLGSSAYSDALEGAGWTEVVAWFSDEDGYGPSAAIYSKS